jgi:hypothetical protein
MFLVLPVYFRVLRFEQVFIPTTGSAQLTPPSVNFAMAAGEKELTEGAFRYHSVRPGFYSNGRARPHPPANCELGMYCDQRLLDHISVPFGLQRLSNRFKIVIAYHDLFQVQISV